MRVTLACNFPRDERLGTSRTPLRLIPELERLGVSVTSVFSEDLRPPFHGRADQLTSALRVTRALWACAELADVVDITGSDAWLYAAVARRRRPWQAVVARSNGLWYRVLAVEPPQDQGPLRRLGSRLYQQHVLCRWERASLRGADLALFLSEGDAREIVRQGWQGPEDVAVVNPGVDAFFDSPIPLARRRDVAFVGTFFHRKGNDIVSAAMSRVLEERPGLRLGLFGTGGAPAEVLAQFPPQVRDRVTVASPLSPRELAQRLQEFAVFVFPTRYEGFGIVVVEAMQAGLAVVTTPTGAGLDVVRDGVNGLLVPIGDVDATAAAVRRLLDDDALRLRLAEAAIEDTRDRSWSRAARQLVEVYRRAQARASLRAVRPRTGDDGGPR